MICLLFTIFNSMSVTGTAYYSLSNLLRLENSSYASFSNFILSVPFRLSVFVLPFHVTFYWRIFPHINNVWFCQCIFLRSKDNDATENLIAALRNDLIQSDYLQGESKWSIVKNQTIRTEKKSTWWLVKGCWTVLFQLFWQCYYKDEWQSNYWKG